MLRSPDEIQRYVDSIDLPDAGPSFEAVIDQPTGDLIAVGAQLAEFAGDVSEATRLAVSDAMLLAQLAADKGAVAGEEVFAWYDRFVAVLRAIGFSVADKEESTEQVSDKDLSLHQAAIPVIAAAFGPAIAASSLILKALDGLQAMDADQPWITLFERNSQHVHGAKFQVSRIEADGAGNPKVTLLCFAVTAKRTITQVLFLKFSDNDVELRQSQQLLTCSMATLPSDAIAGKVKPFLAANVEAIDL